jgi:hypothetical protein
MSGVYQLLYCHYLGRTDMLTVYRLVQRLPWQRDLIQLKWAFMDRYRI